MSREQQRKFVGDIQHIQKELGQILQEVQKSRGGKEFMEASARRVANLISPICNTGGQILINTSPPLKCIKDDGLCTSASLQEKKPERPRGFCTGCGG
jgi:hypothetical protein